MLVIRQGAESSLPTVTLIQIRFGAGWYENGILKTSYAANGSSNVWTWTVPTKAFLTISGCGGGGGGAGGFNNGASAGSGGGGGGSGLAIQNFPVIVPAGEVIKITIGAGGAAGPPDVDNSDWGRDTIIEFTSLYPGSCDLSDGGSIGHNARLYLGAGQRGHVAVTGATGFGTGGHGGYGYTIHPNPIIAAAGLASGAAGAVALLANPPYTRQANGAGAGGNPGVAGGGNDTHVGYGFRGSVGGAVADGAGGGGCGGTSLFGPGANGGAGHANAPALTWGYGSGGGGGGGNAAGSSNAGWGADGRPGYVEIIYQVVQ